MKVLSTADVHGRLAWLEWLAKRAHNYDLVCVAGDLLDAHSRESSGAQIKAIAAILKEIRTPMAICSGNHDFECGRDLDARGTLKCLKREGVFLDGESFHLNGLAFRCVGWVEPLPAVTDPNEIWIMHSPPANTPTSRSTSGGDFGDYELSLLCRAGNSPRIVLCGHVHSPVAWNCTIGDTLILNPGYAATSDVPAHVVLDLEHRIATRFMPGVFGGVIEIPRPDPRGIKGFSAERFERLLRFTISNQAIEGFHLTKEEIEEVRRRLKKLTGGE